MNILKKLYEALPGLVAALAAIAVVVLVLWAANWFLLRRNRNLGEELEKLHLERGESETKISELEEQLKSAEEGERSGLESEVARLRRRCDDIAAALESAEGEARDGCRRA